VLAVGRTYPSDAVYTQMMLRVISAYGWENIAILHGNDEYANSFALGMQTNTAAAGVSVVTAISYEINDRSTYGPACARASRRRVSTSLGSPHMALLWPRSSTHAAQQGKTTSTS
jgi:ABC-type branched-subunit amino acid transport system substrate-binding protein